MNIILLGAAGFNLAAGRDPEDGGIHEKAI